MPAIIIFFPPIAMLFALLRKAHASCRRMCVCARARVCVFIDVRCVYACMYVYSRARAREYVCK